MNWKKNDNFAFLGGFLAVTGLLSAAVLAITNGIVAPRIEAAENRAKAALFGDLVPAFSNRPADEKTSLGSVTLYPAKKNGKLVGVIAEATGPGYGGAMTVLVGFTPDGSIRQILVTADKETPGLGKKCTTRQFKKTIFNFWKSLPPGVPPNPFLDQFRSKSGRTVPAWRVKKDGGPILEVTGATVTSRAVTKLAGEAAVAAQKYLSEKAGKK